MIEKKELKEFESKWNKIRFPFEKILEQSLNYSCPAKMELKKNEYVELYTAVYDIMIMENPQLREQCFENLISLITGNAKKLYDIVRERNSITHFISAINAFVNLVLPWVMKVFVYMGRVRALSQKNYTLEEMIKDTFRKEFYDKINDDLRLIALKELNLYRKGKLPDLDFGLYKKFLESMMLFDDASFQYTDVYKSTEEYFITTSNEILSDSFIKYLFKAFEIRAFEDKHLRLFIDESTSNQILERFDQIFFYEKSRALLSLDDGFCFMLKSEQIDYLKTTFDTFSKDEESMDYLINFYKEYISNEYTNFLAKYGLNKEDDKTTPEDVATNSNFLFGFLKFQGHIINDIIFKAFPNNTNLFIVVFKEVLDEFQTNRSNINPTFLLPYFFNSHLKKDSSYEEAITTIDKYIPLFHFVSQKDVFINLHRILLSHRLLNEDFISLDAENYLINQLKIQCGTEYVANIENMIKDYLLNKEIGKKYQSYLSANQITNKIANSFIVLTTENWPSFNTHKVKLGDELSLLTNLMFKFYHENFNGRILHWALLNSSIEILGKGFAGGKNYTFTCNTVQGIILAQFVNFETKLSREEIIAKLNFECEEDFNSSIIPLFNVGLLGFSQNKFMINRDFSSEKDSVRVPSLLKDEEIVKKKVNTDRILAVDGIIMKIMKRKKWLEHDELIQLSLEKLEKFKVDQSVIEKRITSLIEKELMMIDDDHPGYYIYLAH